MKTPLTAIFTGVALGLLSLFYGRQVDVVFWVIILFGTGLIAWTLEQYEQHRPY